MTEAHALQSPAPIATRPRKIVRRTRGNRHGPITRLISPGDLGQLLKARDGPARVLVGTHRGATSSLNGPASLNYLAVRLRAGESWRYQPAIDHTVCRVALSTGRLLVPESVGAGELAIFEPSNDAIDVYAEADAEFILGSAVPHPHDLVLGPSVRTFRSRLSRGNAFLPEVRRRGHAPSHAERDRDRCGNRSASKARLIRPCTSSRSDVPDRHPHCRRSRRLSRVGAHESQLRCCDASCEKLRRCDMNGVERPKRMCRNQRLGGGQHTTCHLDQGPERTIGRQVFQNLWYLLLIKRGVRNTAAQRAS
jgi:hypothetical protein